MHKLLALGPILLTACAAQTASEEIPTAGNPSGAVCRGEGLSAFVGREATGAVAAELLRASGARDIRWVQPGMMVTMDFREDRLTVRVDAVNRIERANCG